jgi:hypothetical protein
MALASTGVRYDFIGRDVSAGRTADHVKGKFGALGTAAGTAGKAIAIGLGAAAVGGVAALGAAMVKGVKDAQSYQALAFKTAAVIKSTGNVANVSVKGIQSLAASLESLSGVDEELIINSQNVLTTFTKIRNETGRGNDIFNQATKAALNMSTALGTDLQGASIQVGKALNDPIKGVTALSRVGVSFTQQQKDQIKTLVESGRTLDAQKLILAELNVEFGGAAKAAGSGFAGSMARAQDAAGDFARDLGTRALPKLTAFADWFAVKGIPKLRDFADFIEKDLIPDVVGEFRDLKGKVEAALPDIDWSRAGASLKSDATKWAGSVIAGIQLGFDKGDWGPLGQSLGDGLGEALSSAVGVGAAMSKAVIRWAGEVDWYEVGVSVGKQTAPFAVGFLAHLGENLMTTAREHPFDTALAISSFFALGKVGGIVARVVGRIPGLRTVFRPLLSVMLKWDEFTAPVNNAVGRFARSVARGFTSVFARMFPGVGRDLGKHIRGLADGVGARALYMQGAAEKFARGIGPGIGRALAHITIATGRIIWRLTSPFRTAGVWLFSRGVQLVSGLIRGIANTSVGRTIIGVIGRLTSPFRRAGSWLIGPGRNVISGLLGGIRDRMAGIGGWVKSVVVDPIIRAVKSFFGIRSPSTVMAGIGGHLIGGLIQGMVRANPGAIAGKVFGGMPAALGAIVGKGLISLRGLPGKALDALSGLGGKFAGLLDGIGGFLGGGGGSGAGLVAFGRWLQEMGYTVTEHPAFGGVTYGAHVKNSAHYAGRAIDVNHGAGTSRAEQEWLAKIIGPAHQSGFKTIFMAPGHYNHAHIAYANGGVIGEPVFGRGAWSGRSYSFAERGNETVLPGVHGRGGTTVVYSPTYQFPHYVGSHDELVRSIKRADSRGDLDSLSIARRR